jgi:hypothetical protein
MKTIWIVTKPTPLSTEADICFECTPHQLDLQFKGGLTSDEIYGWYAHEADARPLAKALLHEMREALLEQKKREESEKRTEERVAQDFRSYGRVPDGFAKHDFLDDPEYSVTIRATRWIRDRSTRRVANAYYRYVLCFLKKNDATPFGVLMECASESGWPRRENGTYHAVLEDALLAFEHLRGVEGENGATVLPAFFGLVPRGCAHAERGA